MWKRCGAVVLPVVASLHGGSETGINLKDVIPEMLEIQGGPPEKAGKTLEQLYPDQVTMFKNAWTEYAGLYLRMYLVCLVRVFSLSILRTSTQMLLKELLSSPRLAREGKKPLVTSLLVLTASPKHQRRRSSPTCQWPARNASYGRSLTITMVSTRFRARKRSMLIGDA